MKRDFDVPARVKTIVTRKKRGLRKASATAKWELRMNRALVIASLFACLFKKRNLSPDQFILTGIMSVQSTISQELLHRFVLLTLEQACRPKGDRRYASVRLGDLRGNREQLGEVSGRKVLR